jgi:hypothetical protein
MWISSKMERKPKHTPKPLRHRRLPLQQTGSLSILEQHRELAVKLRMKANNIFSCIYSSAPLWYITCT